MCLQSILQRWKLESIVGQQRAAGQMKDSPGRRAGAAAARRNQVRVESDQGRPSSHLQPGDPCSWLAAHGLR